MTEPTPNRGSNSGESAPVASTPRIIRKTRGRVSWIWLVPIVAAIAGLSLVARTWLQAGPEITIQFDTAEGLAVGETQVRYKDVVIGTVRGIRFNHDRSKVLVEAALTKDAADIAREGTRFWVVRPRLGFTGVSGLGTLLSGAYIGVDVPQDRDASERKATRLEFVGLETPPAVTHDRAGRRFTLRADDLGSLDIGSPVYFRRISVGRVVGYALDESGRAVNIDIFIDAPNDRFVTRAARFWNASGVDVSVNADGLTMRTESLVSLALGGVAFESFAENAQDEEPADEASTFRLYGGEGEARAVPSGEAYRVRMRFDQSIRGLSVGAPVDFQGIALGSVTAVTIDFDAQKQSFYALVDATLYPERLGRVYQAVRERMSPQEKGGDTLLRRMVQHGLRAQLRPANLLTGQLYVVLDTVPNAKPVEFVPGDPPMIPTVPGQLDQLQEQIGSILSKVEKIPFVQIGQELRATLAGTARLMSQLDKQVAPQARLTLRQARQALESMDRLLAPDAPLPANGERAIGELARAARSLRELADYLQTHPEALLRGRGEDSVPGTGQ